MELGFAKVCKIRRQKNFFIQGPKDNEDVLGSLEAPHQSKELLFSSRYRSPKLFLTPPELEDIYLKLKLGSELDFFADSLSKSVLFY